MKLFLLEQVWNLLCRVSTMPTPSFPIHEYIITPTGLKPLQPKAEVEPKKTGQLRVMCVLNRMLEQKMTLG